MNVMTIAGHLGNDPETRYTPSGQKVVSFSVAINVRSGGQDEPVWFRVSVWGNQFDKMLSYFKKGSAVIVFGKLARAPRIYSDKNGESKVSLEINADRVEFNPFGRQDNFSQQDDNSFSRNVEKQSEFSGKSFSDKGEGFNCEQVFPPLGDDKAFSTTYEDLL